MEKIPTKIKLFTQNYNNILTDLLEHFDIVDKVENADKVVTWNDVNPFEKALINLAHGYRKKTIVIQHGRRGSSRHFHPFNEPINADYFFVWGQRDKDALVDAGHPEKKIKVVGTTLFSHLKPKEKHEGINIVFSPEHWDDEVQENYDTARELSRIAKINGWDVTTKIINGHNRDWYHKPIYSDRNSPEHMEIVADVLKTADIVVGVSESTFELLAQSLDIPVIIMSDWKPKPCNGDMKYLEYRRVISEASKKCNVAGLEEAIKSQLQHPEELEIERGVVCQEEGGLPDGGLDKIIEEICKK